MHCQKCRTPLKLDASLEDLNPAAFKLLIDTAATPSQKQPSHSRPVRPAYSQDRKEHYDHVSAISKSPIYKRVIPPPSTTSKHGDQTTSATSVGEALHDNPAMSFIMLTESQVVPPLALNPANHEKLSGKDQASDRNGAHPTVDSEEPLSNRTETAARLFEILSSRSDVDHPICVECTELLIDGFQKRLASATKERDAYAEFLRRANNDIPTEEEAQQARQEVAAILEKEAAAFAELERLEQEKAALEREIAELEEEAQELDREEEIFWRERNAFALKLSEFQEDRDSINMQYDHDSRQLERLQRTNVYNDTFCISHDASFATINGLRLGRSSNPLVDWPEINAAWGQTILLLATVADKLGFSFKGYRLHPMGSTSTIDKLEYPTSASTNDPAHPSKPRVTTLELYYSGDLPLGIPFLHRRFDSAMVAFLECVRQLGEFVERGYGEGATGSAGGSTQGPQMPYEIKKDKIQDKSIKLGSFNAEAEWTTACKYTLTCCKFLLAHASNVSGGSKKRDAHSR